MPDSHTGFCLNFLPRLPPWVTAKSHNMENAYQDGGPRLDSVGGDGQTGEAAKVKGICILIYCSIVSSDVSESCKQVEHLLAKSCFQ